MGRKWRKDAFLSRSHHRKLWLPAHRSKAPLLRGCLFLPKSLSFLSESEQRTSSKPSVPSLEESALNLFCSVNINNLTYIPEEPTSKLPRRRPKIWLTTNTALGSPNLVRPVKSSCLTKISQGEPGKATGMSASFRLSSWAMCYTKVLGLQERGCIAST